jgi:hypothetical protein
MFRRAFTFAMCLLLLPLPAAARGGHSGGHGSTHKGGGKGQSHAGSHSRAGSTHRKTPRKSGRHYYGSRSRLHFGSGSQRSGYGATGAVVGRASYGRFSSSHLHYRTGYSFRAHSGFSYGGSIVHVNGYFRHYGTWVNAYDRSAPYFARLSSPVWIARNANPLDDTAALQIASAASLAAITVARVDGTAVPEQIPSVPALTSSSATAAKGAISPTSVERSYDAGRAAPPVLPGASAVGPATHEQKGMTPATDADDVACPAAAQPLARLRYLSVRATAQATAQVPEMFGKGL